MNRFRVVIGLFLLSFFLPASFAADLCSNTAPPGSSFAAVNDVLYITSIGQPVTKAVLENDIIPSPSTTTIQGTSSAGSGTVAVNGQSITYTPMALAQDAFTYTITDSTRPGEPSEATVQVLLENGIQIVAEVHGGDYLFDAIPTEANGIRSYTWDYGDGSPVFVAGPRAFHQYHAQGTYTVHVRADYYSGNAAEGTYIAHVVFQQNLEWTLTVDGLGAGVNIDYNSLRSFPGGPEAAQVHVKFGDNRSDCLYTCGTWGFISCYPYCQPYGEAYYRSGTYPVRVSVRDGDGIEHLFAKVATAVNAPPHPAFTFARNDPGVRAYTFDPSTSTDDFDIHADPPFAPGPYEWDFGDGMTGVTSGPTTITHLFPNVGQYTVTLRLTDPGGEVGYVSQVVNVVNAPPVPKIRVNCKLFDCTFGVEGSVDDGDNIQTWEWNFGDRTNNTGALVTKHYLAEGCYSVTLKETDAEGASATVSQTVPVGPPVFTKVGDGVVDTHIQSYFADNKWSTPNGNLNGILEPGETAVVEPQWSTTASANPVSVLSRNWTSTDWNYANPRFKDFVSAYDLATGTSDCWSAGKCYVVEIQSNAASRNANQLHNDVSFEETYLSSGAPTPGSPITIHVGKSFNDVPVNFWAYGSIESILHAGVAGACNGLNFCPQTTLTRAQIAPWLVAAKRGASFNPPACVTAPYTDVPCTHPQAAWIAQLKADGVTANTATFSPDAALTRGDLSVFVLKAANGASYQPPACHFDFGDAPCPQHPLASWISDIKARGISNGCGVSEFCPDRTVDRAQAASFITRAFGIAIDKNECADLQAYDVVQGYAPAPPLVSLTFTPSPVVVGNTAVGTLTLGLATEHGVTIPLTNDTPAALTVPANVFVAPGERVVTFIVTPANVSVRTATHITATYLNTTKTTQLDVCTPPPAISVQPGSTIIYSGQSANLAVTASGGGSLNYGWYQGTPPSIALPIGTNSNSVTVTPTVTTSYWVNVSNACSSTASNAATVTVCNYPVIQTQPQSDIIVSGTSGTLNVVAGGSGPFTYQWYEGASGNTTLPVAGATSSTFTSPALTANKTYWVRVTSSCNGTASVNSSAATLTTVTQITRRQLAATGVQSLTSVTTNWTRPTQPGSLLVAVLSATHTATPVGTFTTPLGWQLAVGYEWNNIKNAIYYYPNNPGGRTTETFAASPSFRDQTLQLFEYVGAVAASPLDRTAFDGHGTVENGTVSTGTTITTSQPKELLFSALGVNAVTTISNPSDSFVEAQEQVAGYTLTAAVHERIVSAAGAFSHTASAGASAQWLGLIATFKSIDPAAACTTAPSISAQPQSPTVTSGQSATLSVTAGGGGTLVYQWYQGTAPSTTTPVGTNSTTFTTPALSATTSYWVRISNACGVTNSATATVTVCNPAAITAQPTSRTVNANQSTTITVTASGSTPLTYQWYQGAAPTTTTPVGTNSNSLAVTPAVTTNYWVKVSNTCSNANSTTATVTVCTPVGIGTQPLSQSITSGATATLSVTASGSGPFTYQWYEGASGTTTTPVGTNSSTFTTPALTVTKSYWVRVTSSCNGTTSVNSNAATVTVTSSTQIARRQTAANSANSMTSVTTTWAQPTQGGSLLVAVISASNNAYPVAVFTPPAGWQLAVTYEWNNVKSSIYYYPNNPGGRTSETFTTSSFRDQILELAEYTGIATTSPLERTAFDGQASVLNGTIASGNTTTYQSKELLVSGFAVYGQTGFSAPDNGFTEIQDRQIGLNLSAAMHDRIVSATGNYGHNVSVGANTQWVGVLATFRSADTSVALAPSPATQFAQATKPPAADPAHASDDVPATAFEK